MSLKHLVAARTYRWLLIGLGALNYAHAADINAEKMISVGGFGTFGMVYNTSDKADFRRELSQPTGSGYSRRIDWGTDSLLGLQLDATFSPEFEGAVQAISHRRYDGSFAPELTWAFGKYVPNDNVQLRVGRLGFDVYMLADSRSIGYSYLPIRPSIEYFGNFPVSYLDGADLVLKHPLGNGIVRTKLYAGVAREKVPTADPHNYFSLGSSPIAGAYAEYQLQHWQYRIGYAQLRFANNLAPIQPMLDALRSPMLAFLSPAAAQFADDAETADKRYGFSSLGIAYDKGPLQAQLMLSRQKSASLTLPSNKAGYVLVSYRMGQWTPYTSYSTIKADAALRSTGLPSGVAPGIDALIAGARQLQIENSHTQKTWSLGVRFDFMHNSALKFQIDRVRAQAPLVWANKQPGWDGQATLVSVALDFVF